MADAEALALVHRVFPGAEVMMEKRPCKKCKAEIILIRGPKGKLMPFDAKPQAAWYIDKKKNEARSFPSHVPHWATCPNAGELRGQKNE